MISFWFGFAVGWFVVSLLYAVTAVLLYLRWQRERGE